MDEMLETLEKCSQCGKNNFGTFLKSDNKKIYIGICCIRNFKKNSSLNDRNETTLQKNNEENLDYSNHYDITKFFQNKKKEINKNKTATILKNDTTKIITPDTKNIQIDPKTITIIQENIDIQNKKAKNIEKSWHKLNVIRGIDPIVWENFKSLAKKLKVNQKILFKEMVLNILKKY